MKISVIAIGDEILCGQIADTNSGEIARMIAPLGWKLRSVEVIGDEASAIETAVERAMELNDVVLVTGGLGPTKDDVTKAVMLRVFGGEMVLNEKVKAHVEEVFRRRNLKMNALTATQAMVPSSCTVLENELGTAPIMWFERDGKVVVNMPGVPFEMRNAFAREVLPRLAEKFGSDRAILSGHLMVHGISESDLAERLADWEEGLDKGVHLAYLPQRGYLKLRVDVVAPDASAAGLLLDQAMSFLKDMLGELVIAEGDMSPEELLLEELRLTGNTVASAESCTGGNIAHRLTLIPGASDVVMGGVVAYANEVKTGILGVNADDIAALGAVSEPVALQMAEGVCRATGASCGMATSGIAGPGGGSAEKPVGTVCFGIATPKGSRSFTLHLPGKRADVIARATNEAILALIRDLRKQ